LDNTPIVEQTRTYKVRTTLGISVDSRTVTAPDSHSASSLAGRSLAMYWYGVTVADICVSASPETPDNVASPVRNVS